jgi:hypothetical protein
MRPVIVKWEDAGEIARFKNNGFKPFMMESIGFLLSHNRDRVILATIVPQDRDDYSVTIIPCGTIKSIRRLYEVQGRGGGLPINPVPRGNKGNHKARSKPKRLR